MMKQIKMRFLLQIGWYIWFGVLIVDWIRFGSNSAEMNASFIIWMLWMFVSIIYNKLDDMEKKL